MYSMDNIKRLDSLGRHAPAAMQAFAAFDAAALAPGVWSLHTKELIALAVAHTTQCPYCIQIHVDRGRKAGCSDTEIAEAVLVTAALRAGAALTHGTHCFA